MEDILIEPVVIRKPKSIIEESGLLAAIRGIGSVDNKTLPQIIALFLTGPGCVDDVRGELVKDYGFVNGGHVVRYRPKG